MRQVLRSAFLLAVLIVLHVIILQRAATESKRLPAVRESGILIPVPVLIISSLEYKGFVSDLLFIKALIFRGSSYERKDVPRITPDEWQWFNGILIASTTLDPYFIDPYYLANAHMTWEAGMVRETNELLEKGTTYRDWDWLLPFYAGFNSFFFLHDNEKAVELLSKSSERPGPREQLLSLAARLAYTDKKTENAIIFLAAILEKTEDRELRIQYMTRIHALQARLLLEKGVASYKKKHGRYPTVLQDLVKTGIITEIPKDPYGGNFTVDPQGRVESSSDFQLMIRQR